MTCHSTDEKVGESGNSRWQVVNIDREGLRVHDCPHAPCAIGGRLPLGRTAVLQTQSCAAGSGSGIGAGRRSHCGNRGRKLDGDRQVQTQTGVGLQLLRSGTQVVDEARLPQT